MNDIERILKEGGVNPTAVRMLVYKCLSEAEVPMSLSDIEVALESVDKSTISRTLSTFKEHHLIHCFNDGSGSFKFEVCRSGDHHSHDDRHVHFRCTECGVTTCLTSIAVPEVELPQGYIAREINYVISGVCSNCTGK